MISRVGLMLGMAMLALLNPAPAAAEGWEGSTFALRRDGLTLAGDAVRTHTFLKIRVYAVALYVSDDALQGILQPHSGRPPTPALYEDLITRDFEKRIVLRLLRDVSEERIRSALQKKLQDADPTRVAQLLSYFGSVDSGTECELRWAPGGTLEVTIGGVSSPPIADRAFSEAVFGIWLGDQGSALRMREGLVTRLTSARPMVESTIGSPGPPVRAATAP